MKNLLLLLILFLFVSELKGGSYDKLKKDKVFLDILKKKFPTIKNDLYLKYNSKFYWNFFIESSAHLNMLYLTRREQEGQGFYSVRFDKEFLKKVTPKDFNKLQDFFLFLVENRNFNEGINFQFLAHFNHLMCNIKNELFLPSLKRIFIDLFSKKEASEKYFRFYLTNFVTFYLLNFNKQDQKDLKKIIADLLNLNLYLNPINLGACTF